ncbi:hypothetical protein BZA05DRAFT_407083 [Tricharina praecox]|uniref:uncharacterized protein n=1 Tax=Tricharina praecox TaxID=43433 RepID=UPI00221E5B83|nr:uncharacterized protein BZA05DRAFT_407083 [Tricharina praecox]KAI5846150.1 hypothetical protein BZA05DRAFT_407083 [Tricharina praecox]
MVYNILKYRRPAFVRSTRGSDKWDGESISLSPTNGSCGISGIPTALEFERVVDGGTCPPLSCRDFMMYLHHVEHSVENLQFFLWYRDYEKRFEALPANEKALSPEYKPPQAVDGVNQPSPAHLKTKTTWAVRQFVDNAFAKESQSSKTALTEPAAAWGGHKGFGDISPFLTPPGTGCGASTIGGSNRDVVTPFGCGSGALSMATTAIDHKNITAEAFEGVDVKWQPFSIQPFRDEISRIIAIYISEGSPRELNLSSRDRTTVLLALSNTTHPSAMKNVRDHIEGLLRFQSHPNFVRWSICNGNKPRVVFAVCLGIFLILAGLLASIIITVVGGDANRGWRAIGAIGWLLGAATLYAGLKGMCVVLHGRHRRHVRPWELWSDCQDTEMKDSKLSFETLGTRNSYEDEPWIARYRKRTLLRKIFDREVWIEEPALRQIQDTIALQALGVASVFAAILTVIFVTVPV